MLVDSDARERLERRGGVPPVVLSGNGQRERDRLELPTADDLGDRLQPLVDGVLELGRRTVGPEVVELDVRDDGDPGLQREDRAIGLVSLDDQPPDAGAGIAAELRDDAADDPGRVVARLLRARARSSPRSSSCRGRR